MKTTPAHLRLLSDDDLDREFSSSDHDEATRTALVYEKLRRVGKPAARTHWLHWLILAAVLLSTAFSGIAAWPVIANAGEKEWFDF